ncbi:MAG: oligoendopeptidase F, partial [Firmicutes bacterium]|nr:oligoendopeptidase F [Bacillota bacterium]
MDRASVDTKHKWAAEHIYASNEKWESDFAKIKDDYLKFSSYKTKLSNKADLLNCLKLKDDFSQALQKLYAYAFLRRSEDGRIDIYTGMVEKTMSLYAVANTAMAFIMPEISAMDEKLLDKFISDPDFSDNDVFLSEIKREKKYILSEKEERIISLATGAMAGPKTAFSMLNNIDFPYPLVEVDGKEEKLTFGKYGVNLLSHDRDLRKRSFEALYQAYKSKINTIAALYASSVKGDNFYADARGYESALEGALITENIPPAVYKNLIDSVNKALPSMHKYMALRKRILKLDQLTMYDIQTSIVDGVEMGLNFEQAFDLCLKGLEPMGAEYISLLKKSKEERWIDVFETEGKYSGAYAFGAYDTHPYVLLNHNNTTRDTFTMAHELGHALHSYYSSKNQPFSKANYQIFVAEVASTVNEVLLLKHLIKNCKDKKEKAYFLNYYLEMFRGALFRQTKLAEFEMIAHQMDKKGQPLTVNALSDAYYDLNKRYYGEGVFHNDEIRYEWARIPHFYTAFYVYKYSTGVTAAVVIAKKILEDKTFAKTYIKEFLSAGGSDSSFNVLKRTGVDLSKQECFDIATKEFEDTLKELEALI